LALFWTAAQECDATMMQAELQPGTTYYTKIPVYEHKNACSVGTGILYKQLFIIV